MTLDLSPSRMNPVPSSMPRPIKCGRSAKTPSRRLIRLRRRKCWSKTAFDTTEAPANLSLGVAPLDHHVRHHRAPADVPPITPPRLSKALNSRSTRVPR